MHTKNMFYQYTKTLKEQFQLIISTHEFEYISLQDVHKMNKLLLSLKK